MPAYIERAIELGVLTQPGIVRDSVSWPERCWLQDTHNFRHKLQAPNDTTRFNNTFWVTHGIMDITPGLDEVEGRSKDTEKGPNKEKGCMSGGCINNAGVQNVYAHENSVISMKWRPQ